MDEQLIGVIEKVSFGLGGYQDCQLGLSITMDFKTSGCQTFLSGGWIHDRTKETKWTERDRAKSQAKLCSKIIELLKQAKVSDVTQLVGKPIVATFERGALKDWRILTEVIL